MKEEAFYREANARLQIEKLHHSTELSFYWIIIIIFITGKIQTYLTGENIV